MRYLYAYFKNYIGFYNGSGLNELEIDFTKCKNNIVLICGINGSGKSTLLDSLSPFVDSNSCYIPGYEAEKKLRLIHGEDIFDIHIISQVDSKGGRKQAKAYIYKNGLSLNDNGNITSYKDIIFSEFDMDSNYLSLTKLSSTNRGLGDKTPAERKKFASSIIDNLETYNEIYKTLNKKSLIFKSHINTLHTKIQNIGSKEELEMRLSSLQQRSDSLSNEIMGLNNKIVELQTRSTMNQEDINRLEGLKKQKEEIESRYLAIDNEIHILSSRTHIDRNDIYQEIQKDQLLGQTYLNRTNQLNADWKSSSDRLVFLSDTIHELEATINSYYSTIDETLSTKYNESKERIDSYKNQLLRLNILEEATIEGISSLLEFYRSLIRRIDLFYEGLNLDQITYIGRDYDPERTISLQRELEKSKSLYTENKEKEQELIHILGIMSVLDQRPKNCKIDTCSFIAEATALLKEYTSIKNVKYQKEHLQDILQSLTKRITELEELIEISAMTDRKRTELDLIANDILNRTDLISYYDPSFGNILEFYNKIANSNPFNDQRNPTRLIDGLNLLKQLQAENIVFDKLQIEYNAMNDKLNIIQQNKDLIEKNQKELEECQKKTSNLKKEMDQYSSLMDSLNKKLELELEFSNKMKEYERIKKEELEPIEERISDISKKSSNSILNMNQIVSMKQKIDELNHQMQPIALEIQTISGKLTMLDSYYQEFNLYSTKFNMIETLKKYCSPTGGGIQTIFMQLYMSKTLDLANQILSMLFNGEYRLLDFVINQNEFRIPFVGSGLEVDDISSGSCSQIAMMGLAINMALFYQASTKYNIPRFDEIDSGLDNHNREQIITIFSYIIKMLNIEQAFIISHSIELDNSLVDIIKLKLYDNTDQIFLGNVIFDYQEYIKKGE